MADGISIEALGVSIGVLAYSIICLTLSTLLVLLLISFGEGWTYVTLLTGFTTLSTFASIVQQIYYAVAWERIKQAQFEKAVASLTEKGFIFGGGDQIVETVLFFIQFWCYNTMALNILFWTIALFTGSWGIRSVWMGAWLDRIGPISKIFAFIFPSVIIGLMNAKVVTQSGPAYFVVATFTLFLSSSVGSFLLVLILYKYMKTRRLASGGVQRGRWWASDNSKSQQSRDLGSHYTVETGAVSNKRKSIYDRALVTRFSIGFVILAVFEVAIVVFSLIQANTNIAIAAAGVPDFSTSGAIVEILLFIPGVTASLVTYLVFGTAKSWRQYRDLVTGGCGVRKKLLQQKIRRDEERNRTQGLEFERLPSLQHTQSAEERARVDEAQNRVKMFARDARGPSDDTTSSNLHPHPSFHTTNIGNASHLNFHHPRPSIPHIAKRTVSISGTIEVGLVIDSGDQFIQNSPDFKLKQGLRQENYEEQSRALNHHQRPGI